MNNTHTQYCFRNKFHPTHRQPPQLARLLVYIQCNFRGQRLCIIKSMPCCYATIQHYLIRTEDLSDVYVLTFVSDKRSVSLIQSEIDGIRGKILNCFFNMGASARIFDRMLGALSASWSGVFFHEKMHASIQCLPLECGLVGLCKISLKLKQYIHIIR